jgi:hypothetical protein
MPFEVRYQGGRMLDPTINCITEPARVFHVSTPRDRSKVVRTLRRPSEFLSEDFWTRPKNMSRYEGLTKRESLELIYNDLLSLENALTD